MLKATGMLFRIAGTLLGGASFAVLTWKGFHLELGPLSVAAVKAFADLFDTIFGDLFNLIEPVLIWLGEDIVAFFRLGLEPHWKQLVTLSWLYIGADARNAFSGNWPGAKVTGLYRIGFGAPTALGGAMLSGLFGSGSMYVVFPMIAAFALYRVWFAVRYAFERKLEGHDFVRDLKDKLKVALQFAAVGVAVALSGIGAQQWVALEWQPVIPIGTIYVLIAILVAFHLWEGSRNAGKTRRAEESWRQSFLRQGNTKLSRSILDSVAVSAIPLGLGLLGI